MAKVEYTDSGLTCTIETTDTPVNKVLLMEEACYVFSLLQTVYASTLLVSFSFKEKPVASNKWEFLFIANDGRRWDQTIDFNALPPTATFNSITGAWVAGFTSAEKLVREYVTARKLGSNWKKVTATWA